MAKETKITADTLIRELTKAIARTANLIEVVQKANTVVIQKECAEDFATSLTKLLAKINECSCE